MACLLQAETMTTDEQRGSSEEDKEMSDGPLCTNRLRRPDGWAAPQPDTSLSKDQAPSNCKPTWVRGYRRTLILLQSNFLELPVDTLFEVQHVWPAGPCERNPIRMVPPRLPQGWFIRHHAKSSTGAALAGYPFMSLAE
jgi:hypothetical protein